MRKIVFTNGCFDILHVGHVRLLNWAKRQGDYLIVGLNSDKSVSRLKGPERPVNNELDRKEVLESIKDVDEVIIFNSDTPLELIESIRPSVLIKGGDYQENKVVGYSLVNSYGGVVKIFDYVEGKSSSSIINRI